MKTKIFTLLLVLTASIGTAFASITINGIAYNLNGTTATVVSGGNYTGSVVIPASVTYNNVTYSVTSIGSYAFYQCTGLTSVTIPNSVTCIEDRAFYGCSGLITLTIGNSVTSIGVWAFARCNSLSSIVIPNSVVSIGTYAFGESRNITHVTIGSGVTSIGEGAFRYCSKMVSISVEAVIPPILESEAFYYTNNCPIYVPCGTLESYQSGWSQYSSQIQYSALEYSIFGKVNIDEAGYIQLPQNKCEDITAIPNNGYYFTQWSDGNMDNPRTIVLTQDTTIEAIFDYRLSGKCGKDSALTWTFDPASKALNITGNGALSENYTYGTFMESITIGNEVTSIGNEAFYQCSGLTSVTIPNSVTSIGSSAFYGCSGLTSVTIPNSVTSIGNSAFYNCSGLTSVTIPNSVTSIGSSAFYGCSGLTSIEIPNSVTSIGNSAFYGCSGLTSVTIPNSVTSIGNSAFYNCSGLTSVEWNAINCSDFSSSSKAPFYNIRSKITSFTFGDAVQHISAYLCLGMNNLASLTIPSSVETIGNSAFRDCSGLTSVTIPNSVTSIENQTFDGCRGLTSVTIGNSVTDIGGGAFWSCTGLTSVTIPNSVTSIGGSAFRDCSGLTSVTIPNSVTSIGDYAFYDCTGLTSVIIGNSVTSIGERAFYDCTSLIIVVNNSALNIVKGSTNHGYVAYYANDVYQGGDIIDDFVFSKKDETDYVVAYTGNDSQVTLPANYRGGSYGVAAYLFYNDTTVKSITLSNSVTSIGDYAFNGCSNLNVVYIGNSVISIGQSAFYNCPQLYKVIMLPNSVPSGINNAFSTLSGRVTYVGNTNYQSGYNVLGTQRIYPNLNSYFTVDGIVYALSNPSKRTCDIIDCDYSGATTEFSIDNTVVYRNVTLSVELINSNAFRNNREMTKLTVNNLADIGDYAFANCDKLNNVIIDDSVKNIGNYAFYQCHGITHADIRNNGSIGNYAFQNCSSLEDVTIRNNGNIGTQAFHGSSTQNPAIYTISNVGSIGESAFANCTAIKSLSIDTCVTSINQYAFQNCYGLEDVTIHNKGNIGTQAFAGSSTQNPATYSISNVGSIGYSAFANCTSMTNLTVDTCVTTIEYNAFQNCYGLEKVTILNKGNIGTQAFKGSSTQNPATYIINNIGLIGESAFANCTSMKNLCIDTCVTSIESYAFQSCSSLDVVTIKNKGNIGSCAFENSSTQNPATYVISNVGAIGNSAFAGCSKLQKVRFGNQISSINQSAFSNCVLLDSITMPNTVTSLGASAFNNCQQLAYVKLSNQLTSIGQSAFAGCSLLPELFIPKSVISIGNSTFQQCTSLSVVSFEDGSAPLSLGTNASNQGLFYNCPLDSLYIGRELSYPKTASDGYSPFYRSPSLRSIVISDFPTKVETNEFYGCTKLNFVFIGNGVQRIGDYAFSGCSSIDYFSFGNQVQTIGAEAFSDCVAMTRLYSYCQVPPTCGASALADIDKWNCTLYIPKNTINDYAAANQWMDFFFIEENEEGGEGIQYTISVDFDATKGTVTGAGVYNIGTEVILIATPAEGCTFVAWEDGSTNPERHIYAYKSETYTATFSVSTDVDALYEDESTGVLYDILGRPVSHPSHGIFIRNGEKILVK